MQPAWFFFFFFFFVYVLSLSLSSLSPLFVTGHLKRLTNWSGLFSSRQIPHGDEDGAIESPIFAFFCSNYRWYMFMFMLEAVFSFAIDGMRFFIPLVALAA